MANEDKVDGKTKRAADTALMKKATSPDSHRAILAGELSLEETRELERNAAPSGPAVRANRDDRSRECMCGCGRATNGRFAIGHDQRLLKYAYEYLRGERELTDEQMAYVRDETDKLERARARVEREEAHAAKHQEKEATK